MSLENKKANATAVFGSGRGKPLDIFFPNVQDLIKIEQIIFDRANSPHFFIRTTKDSPYHFTLGVKKNKNFKYEIDCRKYDKKNKTWQTNLNQPNDKTLVSSANYLNFFDKTFNNNELTTITNQQSNYFYDNNGNVIDFNGEPTNWKVFLQSYNDWVFRNFTTKTPNWLPQGPFDARGYELYFHWCNGTGRNLFYEDGLWGDYMNDNSHIKYHLEEYSYYQAVEMKRENLDNYSKNLMDKHFFEIENGYLTGYEMLHGTQHFTMISVKGFYNKNTNRYTFTYQLKWEDTINPNGSQDPESFVSFIKKMNLDMPKDYNISIEWKSKEIVIDIDDMGELENPHFHGSAPRDTRRIIRR